MDKKKIIKIAIAVVVVVVVFLLGILVGSLIQKKPHKEDSLGTQSEFSSTESVVGNGTEGEEVGSETSQENSSTESANGTEESQQGEALESTEESQQSADTESTEESQQEKPSSETSQSSQNGSTGNSSGSSQSSQSQSTGNSGSSQSSQSQSTGNSGSSGIKVSSTFACPSKTGALKVTGNQLTDASGNPVQLRGISTHGLAWYPDYVNENAFKQYRQVWGANVVRLAMYTAEYGGYCSGGNKENLKNLVKKGVEYATRQDMYVIIDWHILSDGNPKTNQAEAKKFFQEMASTYASYNNVIYEICNEPNGGTSWADIKAYANEIIPVIRAKDPDAIILVGTPNWSQYVDQAAADPITGYKNIMYTLHYYAATHKSDLQNKLKNAHNAGLPIFVSEFGICDASGNGGIDEASANQWISLLDSYGISYVAWNLSNKGETSAMFKTSCSKTSGFTESDLSSSGMWVYKTLVNHAKGNITIPDSSSQQENSNSEQSSQQGSSSSQGSADSQSSSGSQQQATPVTYTEKELQIDKQMVNSWESGDATFYQYVVTLKNTTGSACTGWKIKIDFGEKITFSSGWNGEYTANGNYLEIKSMDYNGAIASGGSTDNIGFIISVP